MLVQHSCYLEEGEYSTIDLEIAYYLTSQHIEKELVNTYNKQDIYSSM